MQILGSPDLTSLQVEVTWDISGTNPVINLVNLSGGPALGNLTWWILALSPTNTIIHEGTEGDPDIIGAWSNHVITSNWPRPFNQLEWSGAPYQLTLYVKDSAGNIYSITKQVSICRPNGNTSVSKNFYGVGKVTLNVKCEEARIFFEDITNHSYKGLDGDRITSVLRVIYPVDETGTIPEPFIMADFSSALVPITYSSDNYQFLFSTIYDYDFGDYTHVRIKYQSQSKNGNAAISFPVLCNIDLCPLVCEVQKLIDSIETGSCSDVEAANQKLSLINPKLWLAVMGKQEPLCGVDVPRIIEEIKSIGGFDCNCCNAPTGIIPQSSSIVDGYNFLVNPVCGDITGTVTVNGTNITFNLQDKSYIFDIYQNSPGTLENAFQVIPSTSGCTKRYSLAIDDFQFAEDLLNFIGTDAGLVNLLNSLVQNNGSGSSELVVDGECIFTSSATCDYVFTLSNIPVNTTFALLSSIKIGNITHPLSFAFNLTNLPALQTYLNGLGFGTFVVANPSGQTVTFTSNANASDISSINYKISSTTLQAGMLRNCTGFVPIDPNEVVQNIISYVCALDDTDVVTSQDYTITYVTTGGQSAQVTVLSGSTLAQLITELLERGAETIENIGGAVSVNCDNIKSSFGANTLLPTGTDFLMGTKGNGTCSRVGYLDAFSFMLQAGISNATIKTAFCEFVMSCGAGQVCAPYDYFEVLVTNYDATCVEIVGIQYLIG